jgi:Kdo2-lipid IVA lauroyltransferase/acyltransferase
MTRALLEAVSRLPRGLRVALATILGDAWFYLVRVRRRQALDNLAASSLDPGPPGRRRLVRRVCRHLVLNVLELPGLLRMTDERFFERVEVRGEANLHRAADGGRGILVVTAHLGNWELLGNVATRLGFATRLVTRPLAGAGSQRWVQQQRQSSGAEEIAEGAADLRRLMDELRSGCVVGLTADQRLPARRRALVTGFLGRRTRVSRAAAMVALRTGCAVVVVTTHRLGTVQHVVQIEEPIWPEEHGEVGLAARADAFTARLMEELERAIAAHPDQWLWHHRRWADMDRRLPRREPVPDGGTAWPESA